MRINKEWHLANRMPVNATIEQRIAWHLKHASECGCRDMPTSIKFELKRRGRLPTQQGPQPPR